MAKAWKSGDGAEEYCGHRGATRLWKIQRKSVEHPKKIYLTSNEHLSNNQRVSSSLLDGSLRADCEGMTKPLNGEIGNCAETLASGASCRPACNSG